MKTLVLIAHPDLSQSGTNRLWAEALSQMPDVTVRDLAAVGGAEMSFDPVQEQALLRQADRIVLQFPLYWYSSPPVLKAWLDQVLLMGFAYGPTGSALAGKEMVLAVTTGGPAESYQHAAFNNFTMDEFLTPFQQTGTMVGMRYLTPYVLHSALRRDRAAVAALVPEMISHVIHPDLPAVPLPDQRLSA